jgi:hypothetical protein
MKLEMRQKLAREPFAEKIRKVGQLIRLARTFPHCTARITPAHPGLSAEVWAKKDAK